MKMVAGVSRLEIEQVIGHNRWELKKKPSGQIMKNPPW